MPLVDLLGWFVAGMLLCNAAPHFVSGLQGRKFQSPFAKPPGVGLSSSTTNVGWGMINLIFGWLLLSQVGAFDIRAFPCAAAFGAGVTVTALLLARYFGRFHGGND